MLFKLFHILNNIGIIYEIRNYSGRNIVTDGNSNFTLYTKLLFDAGSLQGKRNLNRRKISIADSDRNISIITRTGLSFENPFQCCQLKSNMLAYIRLQESFLLYLKKYIQNGQFIKV